MKGFKRSWLLPLLLVWGLMVVPLAFADNPRVGNKPTALAGDEFETTVFTADTSSAGAFQPGSIIYGFDCIATSANAVCGLYDTASLGTASLTQGIFIGELAEATSGDTEKSYWPAPYKLVTDLTVIVVNATLVVYHQAQ